ncbi:DUF4282 domain-containing protein [Nautilia sp. PV-1]|uniref:DUF4282 domain-containing protein n=1 Tax=Nautilia sp. PV-1 TaxID=2579250 RepID=UPI001AF0256C|nr:DUF4282 domain-containing protein [Nautilia sp. PV-1]
MNIKDFFFFNRFITPTAITVIYWLMLLGVFIGGIAEMFGGYYGFTFQSFVSGLLIIVIGAITIRIYLEIIMVIFKINSNLETIAKNSVKKTTDKEGEE